MRLLSLVCRCGHRRDVHQHYRPGSDCSLCGRVACQGYRPRLRLRKREQGPPPPQGGDPAQFDADAPSWEVPAAADLVLAPSDQPAVCGSGSGRRRLSLA